MQNIVVSQNYAHLHVTKTIVPDFYYHCHVQMGVKILHYVICMLQRALFLKFIIIRTCVYEYLRRLTPIVTFFVMCRRMFRPTCGTFRPGHAAKKMKLSMD